MGVQAAELVAPANQAAEGVATAPSPGCSASREAGFWRSIRGDVATRFGGRCTVSTVFASFLTCGFLVVFLHRVARALRWLPGAGPSCRRIGVLISGSSIHESASIAPGLILPHPHGVVIGRRVTIGSGVYLFQGVTIGPRVACESDGAPVIGDNVHMYPYSGVLGTVAVGRNCEIGFGCPVFRDLPAESVVFPATPTVFCGMPFQMSNFDAHPAESGTDESKP